MVTATMKQRAGQWSADKSVILTPGLIEQFMNKIKAGGRRIQTVRTYRRSLEDFYDFLPEEKEITKESVEDWRMFLRDKGYSASTINTKIVAVNGLLRYCRAEEFLSSHERINSDEDLPELSREEYLKFLSAARGAGSERTYFLIKVFACMGLGVRDLNHLTVGALNEGVVRLPDGEERIIPDCLCEELTQYADKRGIERGELFTTSSGAPLNRSNVSNAIHRMAVKAGMEPEKCCPRALQRMYETTREELMERLLPFYIQSYDNLLKMEQTVVAWKTG